MVSFGVGRRLVACLLNISEARNQDIVEKVAGAAICNSDGTCRHGATVLNVFSDHDYNRSVITIAASIHDIGDVVTSACEQACSMIDMRSHAGVHPCMGAVDLVPLYPLGEDVGLQECGQEAKKLAVRLTERVPGPRVFYFGWADEPLHRDLAVRRKEVGWFKKDPDPGSIQPDVGKRLETRYGLTGVGASPYVMTCNLTLRTSYLHVGRQVATALRESSPGGVPGVQVLALPHEGAVEIACNVESVSGTPPSELWPTFNIGSQPYCHAPASLISDRVAELAGQYGVGMDGTALVGFTPSECKRLAEQAISQGIGAYWKEQHSIYM